MLRSIASFTLACAVALGAFAPVASAQGKLPQVKFEERTLANGLRVLSIEDHSSPTVAIQVWYHVGSKDDPQGRSGFAHLFEHIMFKGTKNMKDEMVDRLTEDVGGMNNAFTADDMTVYFEVVPSNYLETLLWAEAERLSSLVVNDKVFMSERDVVKEEYRQRVLASPYGRFFYLLTDQRSWQKHPYMRPGIGSIEDLDAATTEDVKGFFSTYYRPDNATLIVSGDFDKKQLDAWVDRYFAGIPKPSTPLPRVTEKEPAWTAERRFVERAPNVPLPAVGVSYLTEPVTSDDTHALRVAEAILSSGDSSRLYQSLVYEKQLAQAAFAGADLREDAGLFNIRAILASGKKPEDAEAALYAEVEKLQKEQVTAAELEKAKNQLVTAKLLEFETNNGKAEALGFAAVILGDPNRVNTDIERLQNVTAADVQRVMTKYFEKNNRVVIYYLPEEAPAAAEGGASK